MIYEGTNEIQAIDLVQRKLLGPAGAAFDALLDAFEAEAGGPELVAQVAAARVTLALLRAAPERALEAADDVLAGCGHLLLAWAWDATLRAAGPGDEERAALAREGQRQVLPQAAVHWTRAADALGVPLDAAA
jgi:hypothetical protein